MTWLLLVLYLNAEGRLALHVSEHRTRAICEASIASAADYFDGAFVAARCRFYAES